MHRRLSVLDDCHVSDSQCSATYDVRQRGQSVLAAIDRAEVGEQVDRQARSSILLVGCNHQRQSARRQRTRVDEAGQGIVLAKLEGVCGADHLERARLGREDGSVARRVRRGQVEEEVGQNGVVSDRLAVGLGDRQLAARSRM